MSSTIAVICLFATRFAQAKVNQTRTDIQRVWHHLSYLLIMDKPPSGALVEIDGMPVQLETAEGDIARSAAAEVKNAGVTVDEVVSARSMATPTGRTPVFASDSGTLSTSDDTLDETVERLLDSLSLFGGGAPARERTLAKFLREERRPAAREAIELLQFIAAARSRT